MKNFILRRAEENDFFVYRKFYFDQNLEYHWLFYEKQNQLEDSTECSEFSGYETNLEEELDITWELSIQKRSVQLYMIELRNGNIIGYVSLTHHSNKCKISECAMEPEYEKYRSEVIEEVIKKTKSKIIYTSLTNPKAIEVFESLGFVDEGGRFWYLRR